MSCGAGTLGAGAGYETWTAAPELVTGVWRGVGWWRRGWVAYARDGHAQG
jgi:hypothetical protein